jgi:hypothetical protein
MGQVFDRVKETTTTTGAGDITLAGAAAGYRTFNDGLGGDFNHDFYYCLLDANGTSWETGKGTLTSSTNLVRTVHLSTNSNAAISLTAGTHTIFITPTEDWFMDLRGRVYAVSRGFDLP